MKLAFVSNYFNHHQSPLTEELFRHLGTDFSFIATLPMREERKKLGYGEADVPAYVHCAYVDDDSAARCDQLLREADVLLVGQAPETVVARALERGQTVFRYCERPLKKGLQLHKYLPRWYVWHRRNPMRKPIYLLCASAYTALDYHRFGLFRDKAFRWGYFPQVRSYENPAALLAQKNPARLLWVGRLLDWKHPEAAVHVAKRLKDEQIPFQLDMIGIGPMEEALKSAIAAHDLGDCVHLLGAMKPDQVRAHMEQTGVFLFTSDFQEGWGAVLNEAMNSGCAVVSSHAAGSAPFLVSDGNNGLLYQSGNEDMLYKKVRRLLSEPEEQRRLGAAAYAAMTQMWNAQTAAERFLCLAECALTGESLSGCYTEGVCSQAPVLRESWYADMTNGI